ncbi:hypothetical protein ACFY64_39415 [Streptomyces collinus]|uniref:hypothetical protein n=1 Tax=Streptomyces collinus TaxID=42684 RepID=UPI0036B0870C
MGGFLGELGKKLAERWLSLLVLPGALYLAVATAALTLGQSDALDVVLLADRIGGWAKAPAASTVGGQVVVLAAVLAGAALVGITAQALGSLVERVALAVGWRNWPAPFRWIADHRVCKRRQRWDSAHSAYQAGVARARRTHHGGASPDSAQWRAAHQTRSRIAPERPDRPTWSGDRVHATAVRLDRDHHLDLGTLWPHLWLHLPDGARAEITMARQDLTRATTLGGWAVLYAALTCWWWPAAPVAVTLLLTARYRIRSAVATDALLREAATRLHAVELARHLGIDHVGPLTPQLGDTLTHLLHTRPPASTPDCLSP